MDTVESEDSHLIQNPLSNRKPVELTKNRRYMLATTSTDNESSSCIQYNLHGMQNTFRRRLDSYLDEELI